MRNLSLETNAIRARKCGGRVLVSRLADVFVNSRPTTISHVLVAWCLGEERAAFPPEVKVEASTVTPSPAFISTSFEMGWGGRPAPRRRTMTVHYRRPPHQDTSKAPVGIVAVCHRADFHSNHSRCVGQDTLSLCSSHVFPVCNDHCRSLRVF